MKSYSTFWAWYDWHFIAQIPILFELSSQYLISCMPKYRTVKLMINEYNSNLLLIATLNQCAFTSITHGSEIHSEISHYFWPHARHQLDSVVEHLTRFRRSAIIKLISFIVEILLQYHYYVHLCNLRTQVYCYGPSSYRLPCAFYL